MKALIKILKVFCLFGLLLACTSKNDETVAEPNIVVPDNATVIYVVRHAEKGTNDPVDPDLSAAGQARAQALKDSMRNVTLSAIYSTDYKRTQQTVGPTAQDKNLTPVLYQAPELKILASKIKQTYLNRTVLIVGHSNTVLETIEAFGGKRPVPVINEHEFNYLFKITLKENRDPVVETRHYGN